MAKKVMTLRMEEKTLEKIRYITEFKCRTVNKQIWVLINLCIEGFEEFHGRIDIEKIGVNIDGKF